MVEARPKHLSGIDDYCNRLKAEFVEARPILFSGPDPWAELDEPPPHFRDEALATVYLDGEKIRWVVMQLGARQDAWSETVQYFYGPDGNLVKRERYLDEPLPTPRLKKPFITATGSCCEKTPNIAPLPAAAKTIRCLKITMRLNICRPANYRSRRPTEYPGSCPG